MSRKSNIGNRGSNGVQVIEHAWALLRELEQRIPPAVCVVLAVGYRSRLAHFAPSSWRYRAGNSAHEIAVTPSLFQRPEDLLGALLHEASHAILHKNHDGGCGATSYYHTKIFRDMARKLGLACEFKNRRYGWHDTAWSIEGVPERYWHVVEYLKASLPWGTARQVRLPLPVPRELPKSGHIRLVCSCQPARCVYANKTIRAQGGIACSFCGSAFQPVPKACR
jgi:uncharacterized Zn-finger protein